MEEQLTPPFLWRRTLRLRSQKERMTRERMTQLVNDWLKAFRITQGGKTVTFDSFECAIHAMAPRCAHCECRVMGHGVEAGGRIYCCAHCARDSGAQGISDRAA
jgi:hypothetical protein